MNRFDTLIQIIIRNENGGTVAGYANHPADRGGETVCGCTRKHHPTLSVWRSLDRLEPWQKRRYRPTMQEMAEIYHCYRTEYYDRVKADQIADAELALQVFDFSVTSGVSRASRMLQKVVGTQQDGIIGPKTLAAANAGDFRAAYVNARIAFYRQIGVGDQRAFLQGWLNRVNDTHL